MLLLLLLPRDSRGRPPLRALPGWRARRERPTARHRGAPLLRTPDIDSSSSAVPPWLSRLQRSRVMDAFFEGSAGDL